jgi:ribonuclease HI
VIANRDGWESVALLIASHEVDWERVPAERLGDLLELAEVQTRRGSRTRRLPG